MKIKESSFVISAANPEQFPVDELPEIAFVGRSNVGKSSLINMLINRKNLARTSSTPGKTQLVNFYDIDGLFRFVDLPGYGYARVSKSKQKNWADIIDSYLDGRSNLLEVFLLVDLRHPPNEDDLLMYDWLKKRGFNGIVLATKQDKIKNSQLMKHKNQLIKALEIPSKDHLFLVSAQSRYGKYQIWDMINDLFEVNGYNIKMERQQAKD